MRTVTDIERRARIGRRHALAPAYRLRTAEEVTRALVVLHATEPATVHLSVQSRAPEVTVADVERALYDDRTLVKQLAMRRTLFVFPRDLLPAAWGSASARVAAQLRPRLAKEVEQGGLAPDGAAWVDAACAAVLARLAGGHVPGARLQHQAQRLQLAPGRLAPAGIAHFDARTAPYSIGHAAQLGGGVGLAVPVHGVDVQPVGHQGGLLAHGHGQAGHQLEPRGQRRLAQAQLGGRAWQGGQQQRVGF